MRSCFTFRFLEPKENKRQSLVIFFSSEISLNSAARVLKRDVEESLVPKNVYMVTMEPYQATLKQCTDDESFRSEFDSFIGDISKKMVSLYVASDGELQDFVQGKAINHDLKNAILQGGMIDLFKKHKGVITSSPSYHFVKPSGDHCDKFIRASNLLVSSNEVTFLAISLLPYFKEDLKRIYVDTSSISYLVNVAIQLSGKYSTTTPSIESFESYTVFKKNFDFVEDETSLVVISATTSGSLVKSLLQKTSFHRDQIVTLFHLGLPDSQIGIFDVSSVVNPLTSGKEIDCEFCKRGSKIIRISGDQFLPETPRHEQLVIKKTHFNRKREQFFKEFATRQVLGWNTASDHQADSKEHFFINVDKVLADPPSAFKVNLDRTIKRYVSRHANTVIYLDDSGSKALAENVQGYLGENANQMSWFSLGEVSEDSLKGSASVIVVAGAITSGRKLLSASRLLRCIDDSASIIYLIGFAKLPTEDAYQQLEKDLKQGGHDMVALRKCPLPRVKENTKTAWDWEIDELTKWNGNDPLSGSDDAFPLMLRRRAEFLASTGANDPNSLFLPAPNGDELRLRRTFAFWSDLDLDVNNASQSDVYWTIQSVLHDLRVNSVEKGLESTYHTTLISPACFDRYNDGVIQACLLRAAKPVELNYAVDDEYSRQMTDVLCSVINNWRNPQGEASLEFLLALWTGRLRICENHLKELIALRATDMPDDMRFILDQLNNVS
jgi:hypothetical protein